MPFTSEKLWLSNLFIPALRRSTTVVSNSIMDQSFFEIRGAESVISFENLAQKTRLSNNIQSTVFFYYHTPMRQLDVKEYFRVLLTSALDRLCGIKFVSDNHAYRTTDHFIDVEWKYWDLIIRWDKLSAGDVYHKSLV